MTIEPTRRDLLLGAAAMTVATPAVAAAIPDVWKTHGFVERAGGHIHYATLGEGAPVVLLHKLGGWIADWRGVAPVLAAKRRLIAIDLPGHGESTMLGAPPYLQSVPESAAMIAAVLDELHVERFDAVGNSLGGCISVALAALFPQRVARLALVSVSLTRRFTRAELAKQDQDVRDAFDASGQPLPRTPEQTAKFGTFDRAVHDEQNDSRARAGLWVRPSERGVGAMGVVDYLPRISAPALLLYGSRGHYLQYEEIGRAKLRDVRIEHVADAGSFVHQEQPAATAALLDGFLTR